MHRISTSYAAKGQGVSRPGRAPVAPPADSHRGRAIRDEAGPITGAAYRAQHGDPSQWSADEIEVYLDLSVGAVGVSIGNRQ